MTIYLSPEQLAEVGAFVSDPSRAQPFTIQVIVLSSSEQRTLSLSHSHLCTGPGLSRDHRGKPELALTVPGSLVPRI